MTLEFDCPTCKKPLENTRSVSLLDLAAQPSPGDIFLCGHCGAVGIWDKEGLREATEMDMALLSTEDKKNISVAVRSIIAHIERNKKK